LDRERCPRSALSIILVSDRITEQRHQPVADLSRHMAAHLHHRGRGVVKIRLHEVTPLLGIEPCRNARRIHEVTEHNREVAAFAVCFRG
jgi:hypothetical protein